MSSPFPAPLAEIVDLATLVRRFPPGAVFALPSSPHRYVGRESISRFLASAAGGGLDRLALVETRANCERAIAVYRYEEDGGLFRAYGIFVLIERGRPADVVGFLDTGLFRVFELPLTIG